jgi:pimeloyl-ACP methyl ester carboxylesterase
MPELSRPDGTRIHFETHGDDGPSVVLATYWSWIPGIYEELLSDLAADHRVVTYHLRGSGDSSRKGPYDMETDIGDLEAVVEAAGDSAVVLSTLDSANRASKLAARRPELVAAVISFGTAPFARAAFEGREGMVASNTVVDAFFEMLENNYRGGLRTLMEATNPQASEDELRERVQTQNEFAPAEAAIPRFRAWIEDDPREEARAVGDRLWIFAAPGVAGPWLPPTEELERLTAEILPQANVVQIEPGPITAPHETAEAVRRVSAPLRAGLAEERK